MSDTAIASGTMRWPARLLGSLRDLVVGTLLCLSPLTSIIALGWLVRRMLARIKHQWYGEAANVGWLIGRRDRGWIAFLFGGLVANIRMGVLAGLGLFTLTLPFTLTWLGAWWAGWENSFNKGYEQAAIAPSAWIIATLLSLPIVVHLPLALAHAAAEGRISAFWEWRRIRSVAASAGWRLVWLAFLSAALSIPFFGLRALPVFIESIVPGFSDMSVAAQTDIADGFIIAKAVLAFVTALILRRQAAIIYARATPRAATGRYARLWQAHPVSHVLALGGSPGRMASGICFVLASLIWATIPMMIVFGQFMNYDPMLWLTHPVIAIPWFG